MSHHDHNTSSSEDSELFVGQKLGWLASPVVDDGKLLPPGEARNFDELLQDTESFSRRSDANKIPCFKKHSQPTNVELFYDLWFVANLQVFTAIHTIDDKEKLLSYIGYIIILWFDWFLVGLYDVRYLADSVFERVARVIHMGVMVGFSVVAVNYTPDQQIKETFQAASLILMVSRLALTARYSGILWHIRHKQGKLPITIAIVLNAIAALIYLGISFRFAEGKSSRVFIAWYVIAVVETILQLGVSLRFQVLSFDGTHLTERITASTLFMLGEGVNNLAENVVAIVKNRGWTPSTIGILTAGITTIYIVFMIYFDWMAHHSRLAGIRQRLWAILHLPFHVILLLFSEGATQFIQWWKIIESLDDVDYRFNRTLENFKKELPYILQDKQTEEMVNSLNDTFKAISDLFEPIDHDTTPKINQILSNISEITDVDWESTISGTGMNQSTIFWYYFLELLETLDNSILIKYNIDTMNNIRGQASDIVEDIDIQDAALDAANDRFMITYQFTFVAAGLTLILMAFLSSILRPRGSWNLFIFLRVGLFILIGIGISLLTLILRDANSNYPISPWLLPTLSLIFFVVLILTHFPQRPPSSVFSLSRAWKGCSRKGRAKDGTYAQLGNEQPIAASQGWFGGSGRQNSSSLPLTTFRSREDGFGQGPDPTPDTEYSPGPSYQQTSGRPEYFAAV
ncbi:hypothetical protein F4824DRAFT_428462 [Ustulina deusta]|nr:hypothetical protein F4824DRAFT_428462 [Ustulina deusta]